MMNFVDLSLTYFPLVLNIVMFWSIFLKVLKVLHWSNRIKIDKLWDIWLLKIASWYYVCYKKRAVVGPRVAKGHFFFLKKFGIYSNFLLQNACLYLFSNYIKLIRREHPMANIALLISFYSNSLKLFTKNQTYIYEKMELRKTSLGSKIIVFENNSKSLSLKEKQSRTICLHFYFSFLWKED